MANFLIKQGNAYSVKVPIPVDVQPIFDKKAFKKSLKTSDKSIAIARSGPLIVQYKGYIEEARGNPTQHLEDALSSSRSDPQVNPDAVAGLEGLLQDQLLASQRVQHSEQLSPSAEASSIKAYKIATGQLTPFDAPLEKFVDSRKVEPKTIVRDRQVVGKFTSRVPTVNEVNRRTVRDFVTWLSEDQGLKNKTIRDNLSTLRVYWNWMEAHSLVPEDRPNPFSNVSLPAENRKATAELVRLPFSIDDIGTLNEALKSGSSETLNAAFKLAIYTGCRIEELASLEVSNVTQDTIQIVRAKTAAGNRIIPVHDALRPLLTQLLERKHKYLLPDLETDKYGARSPALSKQFGKLKTKLGFDKRFVFHSIRKTVTTQLEQADVSEGIAADILGHDKPTMSYGLYSGGTSLEQKRKAIMTLDYRLR